MKSLMLLTVVVVSLLVNNGCGNVVKSKLAFSLANTYGSQMVLQRAPSLPVVWGFGEPGATIEAKLDNSNITTVVQSTGVWEAVFTPAREAGGPFQLTVTHDPLGTAETITADDVYIGDVWLCSGQSNMEFRMNQIFNSTEEIENAAAYDQIRLFQVHDEISETPLDELRGVDIAWDLPSDPTLETFSAVCFFFGQRLYDELKIPIGLIDSTWGGTKVESWSSPDALVNCPSSTTNTKSSPRIELNDPSALYNAMINPLTKIPIKGAIWYQGETNAREDPEETYQCRFPAMIDDWRVKWFDGTGGQTDAVFPFGFVQLSTSDHTTSDRFPKLRWHQTADYGYAPNPRMANTFMAVAVDLPDDESPYGGNHPRDKKTVGHRLSLAAYNIAYNLTDYPTSGPLPTGISLNDNEITVTYDRPLEQRNTEGFVVYCDSEYVDVPITNVDLQSNSVTVDISSCPSATRLAYEWKETPCPYKQAALYADNEHKLPAAPWIWEL